MNKTASYLDDGTGTGSLAGYGQGSYDVGMENVGLVPGMTPQIPEGAHVPGIVSPWMAPLVLAAGGLLGYKLLRGAGKRLYRKAQQNAAAKAAAPAANATASVVAPAGAAPKYASIILGLGDMTR
jgi:hypothetical protein